jgi:hypothetical protein
MVFSINTLQICIILTKYGKFTLVDSYKRSLRDEEEINDFIAYPSSRFFDC